MLLSEFDFPFDSTLVADRPIEPRDQARLLACSRRQSTFAHHHVADLPQLLRSGDLVVVNDTKVLPVRIAGRKRPGGGKVDLLFVRERERQIWEVLLKGAKVGQVIDVGSDAYCTVAEVTPTSILVHVTARVPVRTLFQSIGQMPLPPYIKREPIEADRTWYQTHFAREEGSIAAPTAGLHFTDRLLQSLRERGIRLTAVTLHVGQGTFRPVKTAHIEDHHMLPEQVEISSEAAAAIMHTKSAGGRVVGIGTTVVRTLEAAADEKGTVKAYRGEATTYITPGYRFRVLDALLTNFHLPRTTLLMLVAAFAGMDTLRNAYQEAVEKRYRFYSYGDAMLIL